MRLHHWVWGLLLLTAGLLLVLDVLPGSDGFATGPKVGMIMALWTMGALVIGVPLTTWVLRKTTRPADYEGGCPVGRVCPRCDTFNFNPRNSCRSCGVTLDGVGPAKREPL